MNTHQTEQMKASDRLDEWRLSRIDIRSPVKAGAWPVARVELEHPVRGRVTDIATAPGAFDAAFAAASQIIGLAPKLVSYNVTSLAPGEMGSLSIHLEVAIESGGRCCSGSSVGLDLLECSLKAWLRAVAGLSAGEQSESSIHRPYQVSGVDENQDLWFFASADQGAAQAVAREFRSENYGEVCEITPRQL